MNNLKSIASVWRTTEAYRKYLMHIPDEQFQLTPPIAGWSYSEVYFHIFDASLLSLQALDQCLDGTGKNRPTHFAARAILFFGMFPPGIKFKAPEQLAARLRLISKAEALDFIDRFTKQFKFVETKMSSARPDSKAKHPRLGYLNAPQWLRFIEIHLNHHLKQLKRIEKSF